MDLVQSIPWELVLPILVIQLILLTVALVNLAITTETNGPKWMWALIIVLANIIGPILYFVIGRRQS